MYTRDTSAAVRVLSAHHSVGLRDLYFDFAVQDMDLVLGTSSWGGSSGFVANLFSVRLGTAVTVRLWRHSRGGSVGDGHGRLEPWAKLEPGGWQVGDEFRLAGSSSNRYCSFERGYSSFCEGMWEVAGAAWTQKSGWVQGPVPAVMYCPPLFCVATPVTAAMCLQTCLIDIRGCNAVDFRPSTGECCFKACADPNVPAYAESVPSQGWEAWSHPGWIKGPFPKAIGCPHASPTCSVGLTAAQCRQKCLVHVEGCNAVDFRPQTGECCFKACANPRAPIYTDPGFESNWEAWSFPGAHVTITSAPSQKWYEVVYHLAPGHRLYTDRTATFSSLGYFTPAHGFTFVRPANDDRTLSDTATQLELAVFPGARVYLVYLDCGDHADRPWLTIEGWRFIAIADLPVSRAQLYSGTRTSLRGRLSSRGTTTSVACRRCLYG